MPSIRTSLDPRKPPLLLLYTLSILTQPLCHVRGFVTTPSLTSKNCAAFLSGTRLKLNLDFHADNLNLGSHAGRENLGCRATRANLGLCAGRAQMTFNVYSGKRPAKLGRRDISSSNNCNAFMSPRHSENGAFLPCTRGASGANQWSTKRGSPLFVRPPDDFIDTTIVEDEEGEGSSYVGVDFERQELRVIFESMDKNNVFYKMLSEEQITEILTLTQALLRVKQMPADMAKLRNGDAINGKWKLEFSTEERYKLLPPTTDIYNYIYDGNGGGRLDNVIRFYKSWALKNVRAVTKYKMDRPGRIVFEFDRIEADFWGFGVPIPKFWQDAGFIEIQYFDGDLWIEAFEAPDEKNGNEIQTVLNIYRRIGDATEEDKTSVPERIGEVGRAQR